MNGDTFEITKEEAESVSGRSGLVHLPSLGGLINISSIVSILPQGVAKPELPSRKQNRDGQWCVDPFKNNDWRLEDNREIKVDLAYYPEIKNVEHKPEYEKLNSPFSKELANKL